MGKLNALFCLHTGCASSASVGSSRCNKKLSVEFLNIDAIIAGIFAGVLFAPDEHNKTEL